MTARRHFVYWLFDEAGESLYVGLTSNPEARWAKHRGEKPEMIAAVASRRMAGPFTIDVARKLEREQQDELRPTYDARWRGNGSTIVLRSGALDRLAEERGIRSDAELAQQMGIDAGQLSRVLRGGSAVGVKFLAGACQVFGIERAFTEIFDLGPEQAVSA